MPEYDINQITVTSNGSSVTANLHDSQIPDVNEAIEAILDGGGSEPVLVTKTITQNGTYTASSDNADGYSSVVANVPNTYAAGDEGKVVQSGVLVAQGSDSATENGVVDTTLISSLAVNVSGRIELQPQQGTKTSMNSVAKPFFYTFINKTWNGLTSFRSTYIWTDGDNVYYSNGSNQYILDKSTSTWSTKSWTGLTSFDGNMIWTDGDNIYYSYRAAHQYVLNKSTSTWSTKTWNGLTSFDGNMIWTDGDNIYYSQSSSQYVLNKATSTWSVKTWSGLTSFYGTYIWTDGDNVYYSNYSDQYVLNKSTSTWSTKSWSRLTSFYGVDIWTDGDNIYYTSASNQYILDKSTSTWTTKTWSDLNGLSGSYIWTDGDNVYHSNNSSQYILTFRYGTEYAPPIRTTSCKPKFNQGGD